MRKVLAAAVLIGGCHSHGHDESGGSDNEPSISMIRARVTNQVRTELLDQRLGEGKPACAGIVWETGRPVCARDRAEMVTVALRTDEVAYYCPVDALYWYSKSGVWLGPFSSGLRPRGE